VDITGDDFREGLTAVISVKVMEPQFEGQTKTKLGNSEVSGAVNSVVGEILMQYLEENPSQANRIMEKVILAAKARIAARKGQGHGAAQGRAEQQQPAGQAGRLLGVGPRNLRAVPRRRATRPEAPPSRAATGRFRPFCRCAAKS
jgi:DNA gyrase/topoisomerase IV subunit B